MTLKGINEFEIIEDYKSDLKIEQIKAQMLADIAVKLIEKKPFLHAEEIADEARRIVELCFKEREEQND